MAATSPRSAAIRSSSEAGVLGFDTSLMLLAALGLLSARLISWTWLDDIPHVMDEIAYELQARMYALGRIAGAPAAPVAAFNQWFVEDRGQRYGIFPPGWPAVLALGHLLGVPRWVNPALHALTVVQVGRLARRLGGERVGQVSALLYSLCPQALLLAASGMSHTLSAWLGVIALGYTLRPRDQAEPSTLRVGLRAAAAGFALGWLGVTRPVCAMVIAGCCAIAYVPSLARRAVRPVEAWALPALIAPLLGLLAYNHALMGDALLFPQTRYFDSHTPPIQGVEFRYRPGCNALGFGLAHGCELTYETPGHTPAKALANTARNLSSFMALSAGGGTLAFAALCALALGETRKTAWLLLAPMAIVVPVYGLYWYVGTCYGARFYHVALPFGLIASALGLRALYEGSRFARTSALALGLGAAAAAFSMTARAGAELNDRYWAVDDRFRQLVEAYRGPAAVVLVAFRTQRLVKAPDPLTGTSVFGWSNGVRILSAQLMNRPLLDGPLVFGRYHPSFIPEVERRFPGRKILVYVMADDSRQDVIIPNEQLHLQMQDAERPPDNFPGLVLRDTSKP